MSEPELAAGDRTIQFASDESQFPDRFGDAIVPDAVKSTPPGPGSFSIYSAGIKDPSVDEVQMRRDLELEERALQIADADMNTKKKQTYTGWMLIWLAYQSTGVIYGDIGTSPLYVFSSTFTSQPTYDDLVGALSIIIWTLTLMVSIKYTFIVLAADDDGEGGTFALYSLLARYAHIVRKDPNTSGTVKMERYQTGDLKPVNKGIRSLIENSQAARVTLKVLGVLGVTMVMSDGILTPAQSILGAIQGLRVAQPSISTGTIIGVSCAIIVVLFALQPFGTSKLASSFAPIVIVWLLLNFACGIYNLIMHDHTVLRAFSPYFAGAYFMRNTADGWRSLGGLLLAFTGVEALFADLGAFSKRAIQLSWLCFAFPCILMAYIGQAAYISHDTTGTAYTNPFFNTLPPGLGIFYFSLIVAVLAAIVASQAMITASFQLLSQVMRLSYFPHIKTVHTSTKFHGQIYMPLANWLFMVGCIVVTAVYSNTTSLGNAYGVCVIFVTFITTCLVSLVAIIKWRFNVFLVLFFFIVFGCLDGVYLSASLVKVPKGAWFTLLLSAILSTIFVLWRYGKEAQWTAERLDRFPMSQLLTTTRSPTSSSSDFHVQLTETYGSYPVTTIHGIGIFFDKVGDMVPTVFTQFISKFSARPKIIIFFHMRPLSAPSVPEAERYVVSRVQGLPGAYRLTIRHGYSDSIVSPDLGRLLVEQLILFITRDTPLHVISGVVPTPLAQTSGTPSPHSSAHHSPEIQAELDILDQAATAQMVYVMGKEQMRIKADTNLFKKLVLSTFLWIRENSRTKMADLNIPTDQCVEVGFLKEI